jgi:murein L,D-transpeptidase YcbB/YkuD
MSLVRLSQVIGWLLILTLLLPAVKASAEDLEPEIETLLSGESIPPSIKQFRDFELLFEAVRRFYSARDFAPAWIVDGRLSQPAIAILGALEISDSHGLRPGDYLARVLAPGMGLVDNEPRDPATLARLDVGLSGSTMRYIKDLHQGRFSPQQLQLGLDISHRKLDLATELEKVQQAEDPAEALDTYAPQLVGYFRLREELAYYRRLAAEEAWHPLDAKQPVRPGDPYPEADLLRQRLRLTRDLDPEAVSSGPHYDEALADAVERFQERHGLEIDGVLGKHSFAQLNRSWDDRAAQLAMGLERWRWIPDRLETQLIAVLVPAFTLRAMKDLRDPNAGILDSRVVVGKAYARYRTPIFKGDLSYLEFRPYWNIPRSIVRGEIARHLDDPGYLDEQGYEIVSQFTNDPGSLPATAENLERVKQGQLLLRQRPGPKNALGEVKFIFPNEYNVYLHSTPAKELFARARRDFSHGCIRVARPLELAEWVLSDQPDWNRAAIESAMHQGGPTRVLVSQHTPVYILYSTAVVDMTEDHVHFYDDIYGLDGELARALGFELAELSDD